VKEGKEWERGERGDTKETPVEDNEGFQ